MNIEQKVESLKSLYAYSFKESSYIKEIDSYAVVLEHKKNKARVLAILNNDNNKVFTIGFRTPSEDSTGVAHILEHSVLCGSRKFPLKDPFVELVKGSLNTFLNAMTYMDKTLYPLASTNDTDFRNLIDVYLDAVLYPNIYKEKKIFLQEGWHYELESREDELTINGVVYNEMKGAFSSPEQLLERGVSAGLFEGHSYSEESGGDPDYIPELTYENFLKFHSKYYHPSNSFIYLYGNLDMKKTLEFIDEEYLNDFEYKEVNSKIKEIRKLDEIKFIEKEYPISEDESLEKATYLSIHKVVGGALEPIKAGALSILDYILINSPSAILKDALQKANIGEECSGGYENGIAYPYFSIIVKNANYSDKEKFREIIENTLKELVEKGIDKESILAAINRKEFKSREADYGRYPKGLLYGLETFDTWLYDEDPTVYLRFDKIYKELREKVNTSYYEELIKDLLIDNKFELDFILRPKKNLTNEKEEVLKEKLKKHKESLNEKELEDIIKETKDLKKYQEAKDTKEVIDTLPLLELSEIKKEVQKLSYKINSISTNFRDIPIIYTELNTSGISYIKYIFDINFATKEELVYIAVLSEILGFIDTDKYSYDKINTLLNLHTGGMATALNSLASIKDKEKINFMFDMHTKVLRENIEFVNEFLPHLMLDSKLDDIRIKDILLELKAGAKSSILSSGHINGLLRANSKLSKKALFEEFTRGIEYYRFIESLLKDFDIKELSLKLKDVAKKIFNINNLSLNFIGSKEDYEIFVSGISKLVTRLSNEKIECLGFDFEEDISNEAYTSASMVNYVSEVATYRDSTYEYTGALKVLKTLLSYEYLWTNVRILGGAYGVSAGFTYDKNIIFTSYRDPNIENTYKVYENILEFINSYKAEDKDIIRLIIGTISEEDTPLTNSARGRRDFNAYYMDIDDEFLQKERDEILSFKVSDLKYLAKIITKAFEKNIKVTIGNETKIKENANIFDKIEALYRD